MSKWECMHPFIGFDVDAEGMYQACCQSRVHGNPTIADLKPLQFFHSKQMDDLREAFLKEDPREEEIVQHVCKMCIYKEQVSGDSKRLKDFRQMSRKQDVLYQEALKDFKEGKILKYRDLHFKFESFGNICNLKCVMCGPSRSSKWALETIEHKETSFVHKHFYIHHVPPKPVNDPIADLGDDRFGFYEDLYIILQECEFLDISGGEPSISKTLQEMLDYFIERGGFKRKLTLHFNTNCTAKVGYFKKLLKHYKIAAAVSLDAYKERNDYIRTDLDWELVERNMFAYSVLARKNKDFNLMVCITPQALNSGYVMELIEWIEKNTLAKPTMNHIIYNPKIFSFASLPPHIKRMYFEKIKDVDHPVLDTIKEALQSEEYDETEFINLAKVLSNLDEVRKNKIKWQELWPELSEYYETIRSKQTI